VDYLGLHKAMEHWLISYNAKNKTAAHIFCMHRPMQNLVNNPTTKAMLNSRLEPQHLGNE